VYFTKYTDLVPAFRTVKIDEASLEHCTLSYNLMDLFEQWDFKGDLSAGVIDQRSDAIETPQIIKDRAKPLLERFSPDRLLAHQRMRLRPRAAGDHAEEDSRAGGGRAKRCEDDDSRLRGTGASPVRLRLKPLVHGRGAHATRSS